MLQDLKKSRGFTLVEIVLALAIAGLIVVIVFLAVTGAQKSRRDTARRDYVNRLAAAATDQISNNNGAAWNCQTNVATLQYNPGPPATGVDVPTLTGGMNVTTGAASTSNVNANFVTPTCTLSVQLENGGTYSKTAAP